VGRPRRILVAAGCAAGLAALAGGVWLARRGPRGAARIVLVVVDTLRRDHVSAYASRVPTPNMDALAARGQVFENVFASFHQTTMSMAAMFTGRTPSIETGKPGEPLPFNGSTWCGMARFAAGDGDTCVPRSLPTLAERLRSAGYWTIGVVSNHFLYEPSGFSRGFDDWTEVDRRPPVAVAGPASQAGLPDPRSTRSWKQVNPAVDEALARRQSDRFFLYVHYLDVHDYAVLEDPLAYAQAVRAMDEGLGQLLAALEGKGLLEDAVVVLTSDHGERLGEDHRFPGELRPGHYGNPSWQEVLRVPLIVAPPVFGDPKRFLRTQDFYALLLEIAGLTPERTEDTRADELFVGEERYRTYREGRWKTVLRRSDGRAFLYDLEADPDERRDLAQSHAPRVLAHRRRIDELSRALAAAPVARRELSEEERERLRALGYLERE
jgi:arylsulfatase A-like enzyme